MSDVDPTPETPVTVGDRMGWFRADVQAQLALLRGLPAADLAQLVTAVNLVRGIEPAGDLGQVVQRLTAIGSELDSGSGISLYNLLDNMYIAIANLQTRVDKLQAAIGADPYGSLEIASVRGLLHAILMQGSNFGQLPDGTIGGSVESSGTITLSGYRYLTWPAITGVSRNEDMTVLTPQEGWNGYEVYIQSDAPDFRIALDGGFPTNSWYPLTGSNPLTFSVLANFQAKGYMRVPVVTWITATGVLEGTGVYRALFPPPVVMGGPFGQYIVGNLNGAKLRNRGGTTLFTVQFDASFNGVMSYNTSPGQITTFTSGSSFTHVDIKATGNPANVDISLPAGYVGVP